MSEAIEKIEVLHKKTNRSFMQQKNTCAQQTPQE